TITNDAIFTCLADGPPSCWLPQQPSAHCRPFPHPVQSCLQELVHPGDSISKILKDQEAAWEKEQEKERLKERELECHAVQASKEKLSVHHYTSFSSPVLNSIPPTVPQPGQC
ncbi:hypothetical protein H0H87_003117, partial [Tephrocybe sp. NHM501043]